MLEQNWGSLRRTWREKRYQEHKLCVWNVLASYGRGKAVKPHTDFQCLCLGVGSPQKSSSKQECLAKPDVISIRVGRYNPALDSKKWRPIIQSVTNSDLPIISLLFRAPKETTQERNRLKNKCLHQNSQAFLKKLIRQLHLLYIQKVLIFYYFCRQ